MITFSLQFKNMGVSVFLFHLSVYRERRGREGTNLLLLFSHSVVSGFCDRMVCSTLGFPVLHHLLEFALIHDHCVGDAIHPSHPLLSLFPPAPNPSQHQGLFQWVSSSHQVAKVLEFQLQHQSFQWTPRTDLLQDELVGSPCSPRDSQESSPTPQFNSSILWCSAFFIVQLSHPYITIGKTIALTRLYGSQ